MRVALLAIIALAVTGAGSASAQQSMQSAREQCCKQMGGAWRRGSGGYSAGTYCYGLERAMDAFYKCVEQKSFNGFAKEIEIS